MLHTSIYLFIYPFQTRFYFFDILTPRHRSEMFKYSTQAYGSQFSGEKKTYFFRPRDITQKAGIICLEHPAMEKVSILLQTQYVNN